MKASIAGVLAVLALAGCGSGGGGQGPVTAAALPTGRLQHLGSTLHDARFLTLDSITRNEGLVRVTVLVVGKTAADIEKKYPLATRRETIDCAARTISDEVGGFYDAAGKLVETRVLTGSVGRTAGSNDHEAVIACDAARVGKGRVLTGWTVARRDVQAPPADLAKVSGPSDADAWAWLCAGVAKGHVKGRSLADCDAAVKLNPGSAEVRLDRGYGRLATGRTAAADADFKAVLEMAPDNPDALFGRSLALAIGGARAEGRASRDRAAAVDPDIARRIESAYRILISDPYR